MSDPGLQTHEVTIERFAETRASDGTPIKTYSTGNRGGRPTTWKCRAILLSHKQKLDHGLRGDVMAWKFMGESDPEIALNDRLVFEYEDGDAHTVKVLTPSRGRSADLAFYRVLGEKDTTEKDTTET